MNKELKEQMHKEFDEKFSNDILGEVLGTPDQIKSFIDSLIDKTVQISEERMVKEMKDWANQNYRRSTEPLYAWVDAKDLVDKLSLITNKNDINNDKE